MPLLSSTDLIVLFPDAANYGVSGAEIEYLLFMAEENFFPPANWGDRAPRLIALFTMHNLELRKQMADTAGGSIKSISLEDENSEVVFNQFTQSNNWLDDLGRTYYGLLLKQILNTSKKRVLSVGCFSKGPAIPVQSTDCFANTGYRSW